ncbi:MAG: A/G-specific adenine glycosylase [Actinomycetota bacterium]|nr:A/G-specific adenine glycosylase [Actinomycetota bacterium]
MTPEQQAVLDAGLVELRDLPWRHTRDPWSVLVSEVMLQQTQAARVVPRWQRFLERWPDPTACAEASLAEVLEEWSGLGYPRRARNLWLTARRCVEDHDGGLPSTTAELLDLPGIGAYTARAVQAFAYEQDVGVVDTNIARVLARRAGTSLTSSVAQRLADEWVPDGRGWDWNQVVMDLGASRCRPEPRCDGCRVDCAWRAAGYPSPDPAVGSAGVSRRQARFEGSARQARGRLLAALGRSPVVLDDVVAVIGWHDRGDAAAATSALVESLLSDGLVELVDGRLDLPRSAEFS